MLKKDKFFENNQTGFGFTRINYSGFGYGSHAGGMTDVYGYKPNGETFSYVVSFHRSKIIIKMLKDGSWWNIHEAIQSNYGTNGYTTRIGLKRANLDTCLRMWSSHHVITEGGKSGHDARVQLRNR